MSIGFLKPDKSKYNQTPCKQSDIDLLSSSYHRSSGSHTRWLGGKQNSVAMEASKTETKEHIK